MKKIIRIASFFVLTGVMVACGPKDKNSPGMEFMPDMYRSTSYETNGKTNVFADSMVNRLPASGTIARGYMPYPYANDSLGYENAGHYLKNPIAPTAEVIEKGKELYGKFCVHCHGSGGQGDGKMVESGKYPAPPPSYSGALKNLPEGKMMHTLMYGKGMMGSHAGQLNAEERWKVIRYIQTLQGVNFQTMNADSVFNARTGLAGKTEKKK
jgi:mono/diheme cytochrome c family protein